MRYSHLLAAFLFQCFLAKLNHSRPAALPQLRKSAVIGDRPQSVVIGDRHRLGTATATQSVPAPACNPSDVHTTWDRYGELKSERCKQKQKPARSQRPGAIHHLRGGAEYDNSKEKELEEEEEGKPLSDTIVVPDDCTSIVEAIKTACGEMKRYKSEYHPRPDATEGERIEPVIDSYGEVVTEEDHEWVPGNGQKVRLRLGEYAWGTWSERHERFNYPQVMVLQGELHLQGEDGVCCNGQWMFLEGSKGTIRDVMLMTMQHIPGRGGGMCMHIEGGEWLLDCCQIRTYPGPLTSVLATSGNAVVTVQDCLISRCENVVIGTWGYGLFAWGSSRFVARDSDFTELKVGIDASFQCHVTLERCHLTHNRIGVMMHDDAEVSLVGCELVQNLKSAFVVGVYGKERASLSVEDTILKGNVLWSDDDRPKSFVEKNVTVDNENTTLPRFYVDTDFPVLGLPHSNYTLPDAAGLERMKLKSWWAYNLTSLHPDPAMDKVDFEKFYPSD